MSTDAPTAIWSLYDAINKLIPSSQMGGIVGDLAHIENGGYHISREDLLANGMGGDYSIQLAKDKLGPAQDASALDVTLGYASPLQKLCSKRLLAAKHDPRMAPIREFFGTTNGKTIIGWDWSYGGPTTSLDMSHLFHIHISIYREYSNDFEILAPVADVFAGVPIEQSLENLMAQWWPNKAAMLADIAATVATQNGVDAIALEAAIEKSAAAAVDRHFVNYFTAADGNPHRLYAIVDNIVRGTPLPEVPDTAAPAGKHGAA